MIWASFSRPYEFKREFSRKLLAQGMARELWRGRQEWWRMRYVFTNLSATHNFIKSIELSAIVVVPPLLGFCHNILVPSKIRKADQGLIF